MSNVLVTQGTEVAIATDTVGTVRYQYIKADLGAAGASVPFLQTTPITIGTVNSGTMIVSKGTIAAGTLDAISQLPPGAFSTTIVSGTSTMGTIKAGVGGSVIYVTDLIISVGGTASNVVIGSGTTSIPMLGTLSFAANGGLVSNFNVPLQTASGSALVYIQSQNNTLSISANGFVK